MSERPLLVTGGSGYLGRELLRRSPGAVGASRSAGLGLDVRDAGAVGAAFASLCPRAVIHTAYRQDDRATTHGGALAVAEAGAAAGARLIHLSTDLVFDGEKGAPYTEDDEPRPITAYGRDKADAERGVLEAHPDALVVRTSLLYGGAEPGPQERAVLDAAAGRTEMAFFIDELRCPVHVADLAAALLELLETGHRGVLHVAGADRLDRHEFACLLAAARGADPARLRRSSIVASGLARPRDCSLSSERARAILRTPLRGARHVLEGGRPHP